MPADTRRLAVPESSQDPALFQPAILEKSLLDEEGLRSDGRGPDDVGGVFLECGAVPQAKGSAFCEIHKTKVICSVFGPKDIEQKEDFQMVGKLKCEFKFAPFACRKRRGHIPDTDESELCEVLTNALTPSICLHRYPKSQIELFVLVLEDNGSALAAAVIAASLALSDACIEQYDIVTACTVRVNGKENVLLDPNFDEEYDHQKLSRKNDFNNGLVTVALMPSLNQISGILTVGNLECSVLQDAIQSCTEAAQNLYSLSRKCLMSNVKGD